jgi:rhodanese-related sulfurtransferase
MDITVEELREKMQRGDEFVLIDVREPYEHEEFNIGGKLVPIGGFQALISLFDDHKEDEIVIYCRSGRRSGVAKELMELQGYKNVRNLLGGMLDWVDRFGHVK